MSVLTYLYRVIWNFISTTLLTPSSFYPDIALYPGAKIDGSRQTFKQTKSRLGGLFIKKTRLGQIFVWFRDARRMRPVMVDLQNKNLEDVQSWITLLSDLSSYAAQKSPNEITVFVCKLRKNQHRYCYRLLNRISLFVPRAEVIFSFEGDQLAPLLSSYCAYVPVEQIPQLETGQLDKTSNILQRVQLYTRSQYNARQTLSFLRAKNAPFVFIDWPSVRRQLNLTDNEVEAFIATIIDDKSLIVIYGVEFESTNVLNIKLPVENLHDVLAFALQCDRIVVGEGELKFILQRSNRALSSLEVKIADSSPPHKSEEIFLSK